MSTSNQPEAQGKAPVSTQAGDTLSLAALWEDLKDKNAAVRRETQAALFGCGAPPSRGPGSKYAAAREAYRKFWAAPGADYFARMMSGF